MGYSSSGVFGYNGPLGPMSLLAALGPGAMVDHLGGTLGHASVLLFTVLAIGAGPRSPHSKAS
eukprot:4270153-Pyramimonas_sp.AAC.1